MKTISQKKLVPILTLILSLASFVILSPAALAAKGKEASITISVKGEEMAFDKTALSAKPGQKVKLTFKNPSSMQHNFVLVKPGTADQVANDSIAAGADKNWLAVGPNVIAHTKMVDPKGSDTITFTAPTEPGEYPFICSFPGHAAIMRGILTVK